MFEPENSKKLKNTQAEIQISCSYKKKKRVRAENSRVSDTTQKTHWWSLAVRKRFIVARNCFVHMIPRHETEVTNTWFLPSIVNNWWRNIDPLWCNFCPNYTTDWIRHLFLAGALQFLHHLSVDHLQWRPFAVLPRMVCQIYQHFRSFSLYQFGH